MKKEINVFTVAPNDVDTERELVRNVCDSLNNRTKKDINIQTISWKQFPMIYKNNPQKSIQNIFIKVDFIKKMGA